MSDAAAVNPAPEQMRTQVFIVREVIALLFVLFWLALFAGELITGAYVIPFWFHAVAVAVLGYALGLSVGQLTAFRNPGTPAQAVAGAGAQIAVARVEDRRE